MKATERVMCRESPKHKCAISLSLSVNYEWQLLDVRISRVLTLKELVRGIDG